MTEAPIEQTVRTGTHYPAQSQDPQWIPNYFRVMAEDLEKMVIPKFGSESARDTAITVPVEGDCCFLTDQDVLQIYDGSVWQQIWPSTTPTITHGTGAPAGGEDGDIHLQYL